MRLISARKRRHRGPTCRALKPTVVKIDRRWPGSVAHYADLYCWLQTTQRGGIEIWPSAKGT